MAPLRPRSKTTVAALVCAVFAVASSSARAQESGFEEPTEEQQKAAAEKLRAEITGQIQLRAYDLLDELVFGWMQAPPFGTPTPVVLADVVAPVGFGSGLEALIENHLAHLLIKNPQTNVVLAHCPACTSMVVHSDAAGTVIARGFDQPGALEKLRGTAGAEHALFLDFEAEGASLVLRARITKLTDTLPIVHAKTLSSHTSAAVLLREPTRLISADEARKEYVDILAQDGPLSIPVRFVLAGLAPGDNATLQTPTPIPWVQIGIEYAITSARAWTGSLMLGATYLPTLQTGGMVQARISRLLTGTELSLTHPNVYAFVGTSLALLQGQTASLLVPGEPTDDPLARDLFGPVATVFGVQAGLEVRVSRRVGASIYVETLPTQWEAENVGNYLDQLDTGFEWGIFEINSIGAEVTFVF